MNNLFTYFRRIPALHITRHEITEKDDGYYKDFIRGFEYPSMVKMMQNRLLQRMEEATDVDKSVTEIDRIKAIARKEEIREILMEWQMSFEDFSEEKDADS